METRYVTGISRALGGSGDPAPVTALGTFSGIKATVKKQFGKESLNGLSIAVQGVGHVGYHLCKYLSKEGVKKIGFPLVDSVVQRSLVATGGTVLASKLAINYGISCNTAGGSHHASYDGGAGYCVFNDVAVAAHYLLNRGLANRILIVDLDVHQGNGNSEIFRDNRSVFTFSMHSKTNYPAKKSNSDLDVELEDNLEDDAYIKTLKHYLKELNQENFDFIFYIAGVDIHFNDRLGKLKISDEGIKLRDELVVENFFSRRIPFCGVLGGGYNKDFNKLVELHSMLHQSCAKYIGS